jgi:sarcosine oxidase
MDAFRDGATEFEVIVLGVGGMGAATCTELTRRGARVLGLEQFSLAHDRGSSHGESRIIRKAYFEHPDYVPLLHRAYQQWDLLEQATGRKLFLPTGLVLSGSPAGETIQGARLSARQHGIPIENLTSAEARRRFPGFVFPDDHDVVLEPGAGTLLVDDCVRANLDLAVKLGATIRGGEPVLDWSSNGTRVQIRTATSTYRARSLVITAGPWSQACLRGLGLPLQVVRKFVGWFPCPSEQLQEQQGCPTYFFEFPHATFYGFPSFDNKTVKVAEHSGGEVVADPLTVDRDCHPRDLDRLQRFLRSHLPSVQTEVARHSVCLYTMTPDQHFVIDRHPEWSNVAIAAGFSGHGFKFCPVVGEALADLVQTGSTSLPIQFLAINRPSLNQPSVNPPGTDLDENPL